MTARGYPRQPDGRKESALFASVLKRDEEGDFWLETPAERGRIEVEDAPFLAVERDGRAAGVTRCSLSHQCGRTYHRRAGTPDPHRPRPADLRATPYFLVRPGAGRLNIEARISRAVYYELVALAEPGEWQGRRVLGVWSSRCFFTLGDLPHCEDC